jgi:hypothetical protein
MTMRSLLVRERSGARDVRRIVRRRPIGFSRKGLRGIAGERSSPSLGAAGRRGFSAARRYAPSPGRTQRLFAAVRRVKSRQLEIAAHRHGAFYMGTRARK